ncbi:MAG: PQQ-dependent sugar dehydrogenase [Anaerolineae bacterium]|nr:PQQ-dependent sugar dehydrogenase [Anaerolineae bacterium]
MHRLIRLMACFVIVVLLLPASTAKAITLPPSFLETNIASSLGPVTGFEFAPDGRIFVSIQTGAVRVIKNGSLLPTPFVTLSVETTQERGLQGIAFDPNFATNHYVYIYYTTSSSPIHNRLSRFTANGDVAAAGSELPLLDLETLSAANHNGGDLHFGPDGKLYVSVGENAVPANSQTLTNRLGKILRINADGTIPTDNPFYNTATGDNRAIWALGLRNPFKFTFQNGTGRMFINDVGQVAFEEINDGIAGSNYGWAVYEGYSSDPNYRSPLYAYPHSGSTPNGCAITGGTFYNPTTEQFPPIYRGKYFFMDLCSAWIYYVDPSDTAPLTPTAFAAATTGNPVDLEVGSDGSLYYAARNSGGVINKISFASPVDTIGVYRPTGTVFHLRNSNTTGPADLSITFGASTDVPIVGDWNGDGIDTPGVFRPSNGTFLLSDSYSNPATLTYSFVFGTPNDTPIVGDWDGDGKDSVGVFRPSNGLIYLRNTLTTGFADFQMVLGIPGDVGLAGDWDNDGKDSPGVFRPSTNQFFLSNQVCNCSVFADYTTTFGSSGDTPFVGDWDGDRRTGVGVFRTSNNTLYLRNDPTMSGFADIDASFGVAGDLPLAGHWPGSGMPGAGSAAEAAPTFLPKP